MLDNTLVVFTYAPAGLGHIRVTNALLSGIPQGLKYVVFAPTDRSTETLHRFSSINVLARNVMEFFQSGMPEAVFSRYYVSRLKQHAGKLFEPFVDMVRSQEKPPQTIIIIATHFGLAHQIGAIRNELEKELNAKIHMVVQITDDSPQIQWYVDSADLILCPSHKTKEKLESYAKKNELRKVDMVVAPYPVNVELAKPLKPEQVENRINQYDPSKNTPINVMIPVSGAAVGMEFFLHVMQWLHLKSPRFVFHIVCRRAPFTRNFLHRVTHRDYTKLYVSANYKEVIDMYKNVYMNNVISAEITKPSEQAFKALLHNNSVAGSFLLFAEPVGRQEYDNIDFLKRHGFLGEYSNNLRGYVLPFGSKLSAELIWDLYNNGKMLEDYKRFVPKHENDETGDNGVSRFWDVLCKRYC